MFDFSAWLTDNLISGVQKGLFAREFAAIKVADYMLKGVLTPAQAEQIAAATEPPVPVAEEVPDEAIEP
jgi:hypothetical protein